MSYTKTDWEDSPSTATAVTATRLNNLEQGVADAHGQVFTDPTNDLARVYEIQSDGSSTSGWRNRWEWWYKAVAGVAKLVQWVNEYGELRVVPALSNTVGLRVFLSRDSTEYAARSTSIPAFEVTDQRDGTRTTVFGILKHGQIQQHGKISGTVLTLESAEDETDVPALWPAGSLIVRKL